MAPLHAAAGNLREQRIQAAERTTSAFSVAVERRLIHLIVVCMIIVVLPSNFLYYAAPPLFVGGALLLEVAISARRLLLLLSAILSLTSATLAIDLWQSSRINPAGVLFALVMYLPLIVWLAQHPTFVVSEALITRLVRTLCAFLYIQSFACLYQAIYMLTFGYFNPDLISGTFGLLDVVGGATISQVLFTLCTFGVCMFLMTYHERSGVRPAIGLGLAWCVVAQSGHQTIFFVIAVVVLLTLQYGSWARLVQAAAWSALILVVVNLVYPDTFRLALHWAEKVLMDERSPKRNIVAHAAEDVMTAEHLVLGTGLGQFTSRGALFASGDYLSTPLPQALTGRSELFDAYVVPELELYSIVGESSAIAKPYFSVLSVLTELGLFAATTLAIVAVHAVIRDLRFFRTGGEEAKGLSTYCNFLVIFVGLNSFIENYLEFVQGIFIPIILYILAQARLRALVHDAPRYGFGEACR